MSAQVFDCDIKYKTRRSGEARYLPGTLLAGPGMSTIDHWRFVRTVLCGLASIPVFGQQVDCNTIEKCQAALQTEGKSPLIHYRMGVLLFRQKNFQASANAFREAIILQGGSRWIRPWAHVYLGKIFDVTGQRERALNEYRLAQSRENIAEAKAEAAKYSLEPYTGE